MAKVSIIIPVLNEAELLPGSLKELQSWRRAGHEVIVVDGGSDDGSFAIAEPLADRVLDCERGRSRQLNAGAHAASGALLLFLHADSRLPAAAIDCLTAIAANPAQYWGRFDLRLSGANPAFRLIERLINLRSDLSAIATGDQAIFVRSDLFSRVGGFPDIELMEDIALSTNLRRVAQPLRVRIPVLSSSRRWEDNGVLRTVLQMWWLRLLYFFGADPAALRQRYYPKSAHSPQPRQYE